MKKIIVLGSGMVGRVMAADLAADFEVTAVDVSPANLDGLGKTPVKRLRADLSDDAAVLAELAAKNVVYHQTAA